VTSPPHVPDLVELESMSEALDIDLMSRRLAPFLAGAGFPGDRGSPHLSAARLVDCSPGKRAVVAYDVPGPARPGPALIGKVYADSQRAGQVHRLLEALHARAAAGHRCRVPRPVAHLPELGMSVYAAARGRSLDSLEGPERADGAAAAAGWLASLHSSSVHLDRRFDLAAERRDLVSWAQLVARHEPRAASAARRLLKRIDGLAGRLPELARVPIHKDFHYQHVLIEEGQAVVIDLDEMRGGDPALDVAHFGANLRLLATREEMPPGELARLESAFLETYAAATGYQPDARHDFFRAYTCLKLAKQLVRGRGPRPAPGDDRWRQIEFILGEGLRRS